MASLVDVNVLLAILHERHAFSARALAWLDGKDSVGTVRICRVVQMGVLRLLTRPSIMKEDVLTPAEFWNGWTQLMGDDRFAMVDEPSGLEPVWRALTVALPDGQCAETDAYLAAFAQAGDYRVTTFDKGFKRYPDLDLELL